MGHSTGSFLVREGMEDIWEGGIKILHTEREGGRKILHLSGREYQNSLR